MTLLSHQMLKADWHVLIRKAGTLLMMVACTPAALVVRALRPVVLIRFGRLESGRIGHFAGNTELYLCERDADMHGKGTLDIFYYRSPVSNQQLKKMWERTLRVSRFSFYLSLANSLLPGSRKYVVPMPSDRDIHDLYSRSQVHLSFTPEEEQLGEKGLAEMGIPRGTPFVCFIGRDPAYLNSHLPQRQWGYHDFRNMDIKNFLPAAEELARRGYFALRMGHIVQHPLITDNPKVIDYATKYRTDFLDIYLCAKCHFFVSSVAGLDGVPEIFRRPLAFVNFVPLEYVHVWHADLVFIPKKHWSRREHRLMSFREILESGAGRFLETEQYEQAGIELIENTADEIRDVVIEMDERLKGNWKTTEEDKELQKRFWPLFQPFQPSDLNTVFRARIGAEFLRQNRELLD